MAKRVKIGDVIEIETKLGNAYAQYTHEHPKYGSLLRFFKKKYSGSPEDINSIPNDEVQFSTFLPLKVLVRNNIVNIVGNVEINDHLSQFPLFRAGAVNPSGKVATWWLWDGETEERIGALTEEQKKLPIRGVWNDTLLIERIESGWTAETDVHSQ